MAKKESKQKERKKIFIVDDHPVFREGLAGLIRAETDLTVCGEANSAPQALTAIERLKPDLVLVDIGLPGRSGLELIKDIRAEGPEKILQAIRQVLGGQLYLSGSMSSRILDAFSGNHTQGGSAISRLSDRELEVLQLVGQGKDSYAIGKQLNLSFKTVDAHRGRIKAKLALKNHTELISYAARWVATQGSAEP